MPAAQGSGPALAVLFLTACGELDDKLRGFDAGGVDYMVKPFAPAELLARIKALAQHIPGLTAEDVPGVLRARRPSLPLLVRRLMRSG